MSGATSRWNLRPQERRIVVGTLTLVFLVLNALFVWPHFKDWRRLQQELAKARLALKSSQEEIGRVSDYESRLRILEGQGSAVLPAEQAVQLQRTVQNQASEHGVAISQIRPVAAAVSTNVFFDEQTLIVSVMAGDQELVNFLLALGSDSSMIRVRDLELRPDASQTKLSGNITLVASYQKRPKTAGTPPASAPPARIIPSLRKKS